MDFSLAEGHYAIASGEVGIIRIKPGNNDGWDSYLLSPVPGMDEFEEIQINGDNWPSETISSEVVANFLVRFAIIAATSGVSLDYQEGWTPDGRYMPMVDRIQYFELTVNAFYAFEETAREMQTDPNTSWRRIMFYRLFGKKYGEALLTYGDF
jgi:hypothetical protein